MHSNAQIPSPDDGRSWNELNGKNLLQIIYYVIHFVSFELLLFFELCVSEMRNKLNYFVRCASQQFSNKLVRCAFNKQKQMCFTSPVPKIGLFVCLFACLFIYINLFGCIWLHLPLGGHSVLPIRNSMISI